jgi:nucleotide-binding universal stress UspA family protein
MFRKILVVIDQSQVSQSVFESALDLAQIHRANLLLLYLSTSVPPTTSNTENLEDAEMVVLSTPSRQKSWEINRELINPDHTTLAQKQATGVTLLDTKKQVAFDSPLDPFIFNYNYLPIEPPATTVSISTHLAQHYGDPGRTICQLANRDQADLIVMGLTEHNYGVSDYVTQFAPCLVLILNKRN